MTSQAIEVVPRDTAEAFLEYLDPVKERWQCEGGWVYRGQPDANMQLVPRIMREGKWRDYLDEGPLTQAAEGLELYQGQAVGEFIAVHEFGIEADRCGHSIPIDVRHLRNYPEFHTPDTLPAFPREDLWELIALAQHNEIPTRLLDWTRRSRHGAYFAAREAAKRLRSHPESTHLAVWCLRSDSKYYFGPFEIVHVPRFQSGRIHAQDGLFTLIRGAGGGRPLDELLSQHPDAANDFYANYWPMLRKITLPVSEARKLLRLLSYMQVTAATLFPDYAGVVQAIDEQLLWDLPGNAAERDPTFRSRRRGHARRVLSG